jgi:hypothetical protein
MFYLNEPKMHANLLLEQLEMEQRELLKRELLELLKEE